MRSTFKNLNKVNFGFVDIPKTAIRKERIISIIFLLMKL